MTIRRNITDFGFEFGAAEIIRIHADEKQCWVILQLKTPKCRYQLYVTKTGKVRVFDELKNGAELK